MDTPNLKIRLRNNGNGTVKDKVFACIIQKLMTFKRLKMYMKFTFN